MTDKKYILNKKHELIEADLITWANFFENINNRIVAQDFVNGVRVSTVFLGIDHNFGDGLPLLFETMLFGGEQDENQWRWHTWQEAKAGHKEIVKQLKWNHNYLS